MKHIKNKVLVFLFCLFATLTLVAQDIPLFQTDFDWKEFAERRNKIFESIGNKSIAIIQSGASGRNFDVFRQTNEFYYLCGLETEQAYLLLDGRNNKTTLYLQHRNTQREGGEGKSLSAEDAELITGTTGINKVSPIESLSADLGGPLIRTPYPKLYTLFSPGEGKTSSRDQEIGGINRAASNPWEISTSREADFIKLIGQRFPQYEINDLTPALDEIRLIKSTAEIDLIRKASQLAGYGLIEAMKSTEPGLMEYQLAGAARYIFLINGSRYEAYSAIVGGGTNAWYGHYFKNTDTLKAGEMILMDYAPDYHYYTSDVSRMWPVNGKFSQGQRELYGFIIAYYKEVVKRIKPGVTAAGIIEESMAALKEILNNTKFSKEIYRKAAEGALTSSASLSHPVGMAVHDVGNYRKDVLKPGMVFSIDPMIWVPEEKLYIRIEDVGVVTESGFENFSFFVPFEIEEIEKLMKEQGVLQKTPPANFILKKY